MVLEAKWCLPLRKTGFLKLELDLTIRPLMVMILEVCARKSIASFVMLSLKFIRNVNFGYLRCFLEFAESDTRIRIGH
uniref:Uncharacterized protein n=1 Tax=Arundo donax TaxID=35708 RepID=A0A0A9G090_ARUDO